MYAPILTKSEFCLCVFVDIQMGAEWFDFTVFYGIKVFIHRVKKVHRAIKKGKIDLGNLEFFLVQERIHSRCDCEDRIDRMERCKGLIGFKCSIDSNTVDMETKVKEFLETHREILKSLGVMTDQYGLVAGIKENLKYGLEEDLNSIDPSYFLWTTESEEEFLKNEGKVVDDSSDDEESSDCDKKIRRGN